MKIISGLLIVWVLFACSLMKEKTINTAEVKDVVNNAFVSGEIMMNDGCSVVIRVEEEGAIKKYYPINLSEEFKKEGTKIHFLFHLSRAMQPEGCKVNAVIVVDEIELLK